MGVAPDLARTIADRIGVPLQLIQYGSPGELADDADQNVWDIGLIGAEPVRARSGATPTGTPSGLLPLINKKLIIFKATRRVPVGAISRTNALFMKKVPNKDAINSPRHITECCEFQGFLKETSVRSCLN